MDIPVSLFGFPEFREIWEQPERFKKAAIDYITNPANPDRNRKVALYAAHSLPIDDYVDLCEAIFAAYKNGSADLSLLDGSILPAFDFNTKIVENYEREDVRKLLSDFRQELIKLEKMKEASYIDTVLAGEVAISVAQLRCLGQLPTKEAGATLFCVTYLSKRIAGNLWNELTRRIPDRI